MFESRTIVGVSAACGVVGIAMLASIFMLSKPANTSTVEIRQINEQSWSVDIKELGASSEKNLTAAR